MLVALAAKCLAGLATGLRKKFGQYAGHVSKSMYFFFSVFSLLDTRKYLGFIYLFTVLLVKGWYLSERFCTVMNAYLPLDGARSEVPARVSCSLRSQRLLFTNMEQYKVYCCNESCLLWQLWIHLPWDELYLQYPTLEVHPQKCICGSQWQKSTCEPEFYIAEPSCMVGFFWFISCFVACFS